MAKNIDPKLVTIGEYLKLDKNVKFIIPEYQRKYAWDIDRCDKLWADITSFIEDGRVDPYFFGTIIMNCSNEDTEFRLIDGQQRTTTFMLLLKALLMKINETLVNMVDDSESEQLKRGLRERRRNIINILYKVDSEDISDEPNEIKDKEIYSSFDNLINNSNQETYKSELESILKSSNYEEAEKNVIKIPYKQKDNRYTNFFRNFKHFYFNENINKIDFLNKFTKTILEECQIIEIKSWKVEQAIEMFNSLNSDGMPLTDSDIIYSKMYANAAATSAEDEKKLGDKWSYLIELTNDLESKKIVNINGILNQKMYLYRSISGETKNASGGIDVTTPGLRRYYLDHQSIIKKPLEFCNELTILAEIWNIAKDNNTVKVLLNFNDNSKLFLASYFHRFDSYFTIDADGKITISEDNKKNLIENIEKMSELFLKLFAVLSLVDSGYSSSYFKSFLFEEEIKLADSNITFEEIKRDFDDHINKNWQKENIKSRIEDYDKHDIVYLNEYLFAKEIGKKLEIGSDIDIEHIMPQSGKNKSIIQHDALIVDDAMFSDYINKIGNKILLEYNINRSIGNEWFRTKISTKIGDKSGYINSKYPLATYFVEKYKNSDKPYWTKDDIDKATEDASNRIVNFIFS
jgi:uncharacterized protein with ParB-like and HNH nuclease domain